MHATPHVVASIGARPREAAAANQGHAKRGMLSEAEALDHYKGTFGNTE
jgi:hypothetical protein